MKRTGEVSVHDAGVSVWEEAHFPAARGNRIDDEAMAMVFKRLVGRLAHRGWHVTRDPHIEERYASLGPSNRIGRLGELAFKGRVSGRHVEFHFFQPSRAENTHGGEYDFRRLARMDREQRLRTLVEMTALVRKGLFMGYVPSRSLQSRIDRAPTLQLALRDIAERRDFDDPLDNFNDRWESSRFARDESGWPTVDEYGQRGRNVDADGVPLRNGMVRYLRDPHRTGGRLIRGVVYTNMNAMWMLDTGVGRRWVHGRDLFTCDRPDLEPRRFVPHQAHRIEAELSDALKAKDFRRVTRLARARLLLPDARAAE